MEQTPKKKIAALAMAIFCLWITLSPASWSVPFQQSNQNYLEKSSKDTLLCLACVCVIKGVADVIEGSTVGVNFGIAGEMEMGDLAQPILDVVNIIWNTLLILAAYLAILQLLMQFTPFISVLLAIAFLALFLILLCWNYLHQKSLGKALFFDLPRPMHVLCLIILFLHILLPLTIRTNSFISDHTVSKIRVEQNLQLEKLGNNFKVLSQRLQGNKRELLTKDFWRASGSFLIEAPKQLTAYAVTSIAIGIFEGILIPLASLLFLVWIIKYYLPVPQNQLPAHTKEQP